MEQNNIRDVFIALVRLGVGQPDTIQIKEVDWASVREIALKNGLDAVVLDGLDECRKKGLESKYLPSDVFLTQWIGEVLMEEALYKEQQKVSARMAALFSKNYIRTYVLKGAVVSECYPKPEHRISVDLDCLLLPDKGEFDAWSLGNDLIKSKGYIVDNIHYKNSTFYLPGLTVENHKFITPFRGNKRLRDMEITLQRLFRDDQEKNSFEGSFLYKPPVMITSLFLIEHAYSHFLHEGLTWRHVLDWMMYSRKHKNEIDWIVLETLINEYGFRKFYDTFCRLGLYLLGETNMNSFTRKEAMMLEDVWDDLALHDTAFGVRGKLALAGNTIRAWWKYHYFAEISMLHALWIQTKGYLFDKHPKLD